MHRATQLVTRLKGAPMKLCYFYNDCSECPSLKDRSCIPKQPELLKLKLVAQKQSISVVDLEDFKSKNSNLREQFVKTLGRGLNELGFFAVENHGVDAGLIDRAYSLARAFFELSDEKKQAYELREFKGQRGFTQFGREHARDHAAPDLKEFWQVGRELKADHPLKGVYFDNVWPAELPQFKPVMLALYDQLNACAAQLLKACALYLSLPEGTFSGMAVNGNSILRIIHYPPVPQDRHPASLRAAPHEDINLITLLCESTDGGLELLQNDSHWRPIHALGGQIVVDAGDMLQNVTNGLIKSTTHRVVNPGNDRSRRFSMPYFVHARSEVNLTPLAECVKISGGVGKFPPITAGEYLEQRIKEIGLA